MGTMSQHFGDSTQQQRLQKKNTKATLFIEHIRHEKCHEFNRKNDIEQEKNTRFFTHEKDKIYVGNERVVKKQNGIPKNYGKYQTFDISAFWNHFKNEESFESNNGCISTKLNKHCICRCDSLRKPCTKKCMHMCTRFKQI